MDTEPETRRADWLLKTDQEKVRAAVYRYLIGLVERSGMSLEAQPPDFSQLAPDLEAVLLRIVQEALANGF